MFVQALFLGDNFDIKKVTPNSVLKPCLIVFDMVFLNGAVLTSKPLQERLNLLKSSVTPIDNVLMLSRWKEVTKGDIVKELNISMDKNEEGIIFKKPDSLYVPNNRNAGWWKMKLEVITELGFGAILFTKTPVFFRSYV